MAALTSQTSDSTGTILIFNNCAAGGDTIPFGSTAVFRNTDAATVTVTMVTPDSIDGDLAIADRTHTVAQNEFLAITPNRYYKDDTDPDAPVVSFTYSGVPGMTVAVFE